MRVRRLVVAVHRDLGYLCAALTVVYAVSGVAVNHIDDWNPSYSVSVEQLQLGTLPPEPEDAAAAVLDRLAVTEAPRSVVRMGSGEVKVFLEDRTLTVDGASGIVTDERVRPRPGLWETNFLHLNRGKGLWTWIADVYAAALLVLACTGIFIVPGRKGLGGRGRWLLLAGVVIPLAYLVVVAWTGR